jgi:hypothetical protein
VEEVRIEWKKDQEVCKIIQTIQEDLNSLYEFVWKNDFLWYLDHLYLCKNSQLKHKVHLELHTYSIGGHSRFLKNYHKINTDFFLEGIKTDVQKFVSKSLGSEHWLTIASIVGIFSHILLSI